MQILTKEQLKLIASWTNSVAIVEANKTSGRDMEIEYNYSMISLRARKVLKNKHNILTELDDYDNLTYQEIDND